MEQYKKSNRHERLDKNKKKANSFFGSKKHIRLQMDKINKSKNNLKR